MALRMESLAAPGMDAPSILGEQADTLSPAETSTGLVSAPLFGLVRNEPLVEFAPAAAAAPVTPPSSSIAVQRCLDVSVATLCLLLLMPLMALAALLVRASGPGPVFYSHPRFGRDGRVFGCLKFRTMRCDADHLLQKLLESSPVINAEWQADRKLRNDPRITGIGRFLRRYSVDELPQLLNVLRGDMSIVGPRPLPVTDAHYYAELFSLYCSVRPGITGLWQVSGRNDVCYSRRVQLDCQYARTRSVPGDIWIILRTVPVVLRGTGY